MITAVLCAAGKGERAGFSENKILRELNGLPVLVYSLSVFSAKADEILVVCRAEDEDAIVRLLSPFPNARTVRGGAFRGESVYRALKVAKGDVVLVHDAARPYVTRKIIDDCVESVGRYGSGICSLPATDTTVLAENGTVTDAPARRSVFTVQTPQGFYKDDLLSAYEHAFADGTAERFTDDGSVYAAYVAPPRLFTGDRANRKLTYPEDFRPFDRTGFGVDTHAFGKAQSFITLAGVRIPSESGLIAHSDGDVLAHALMDALLSAAGLRDIGYYFPDTDDRFADADSMQLLAEVLRLVRAEGYAPLNVGVSVLAEKPKLSPFIEEIKGNLAAALALPTNAIGVAAGTNEKLGYVGEGKGITVYATVLLEKRPIETEE
ncbi:MAG: 2-C-methyl-D-erythritol 2,4-cyclodiphosphate synthase [Candidatus Gallimonas sp.]